MLKTPGIWGPIPGVVSYAGTYVSLTERYLLGLGISLCLIGPSPGRTQAVVAGLVTIGNGTE